MYAEFFGLKREPFSIAPDPRYLFMSERHREALAHLLYGVKGGGGFVLLTGEIGAGKTTVCRCFLEQIPPHCNVAYIFNPKLTVEELLRSICDEFHVSVAHAGSGSATVKDYVDALNDFLLASHAQGRSNVLIIDEAQNLAADVLEQLRLLTNLETNERKLLQIVLIGQPELRAMLTRPDLEQLAQRVIARYHLGSLSMKETAQYIVHRLRVAGLGAARPFDRATVMRIFKLTGGVPRRINLLCDRALLGAYAQGKTAVDLEIVDQAAREVFDAPLAPGGPTARVRNGWDRRRVGLTALAALGGAALVGAAAMAINGVARHEPAARSAAAAATGVSGTLTGASAAVGSSSSAASPPASAAAPPMAASAPPKAADAAPRPTPISLTELGLAMDRLVRTEDDAWRALAPAWKLELSAGDPCQAARAQQIQCFKSNSGLPLLRALNRPSILTLRGADNRSGYAVLSGLDDRHATLVIAGTPRALPLEMLTQVWRGEFGTYWRAPPGFGALPGDGQSGPVIDRLAAQLASLRGEPAPTGAQRLDSTLRSKIHDFQRANGLWPNGLPGATTFMQLNRATGVDEPRLLAR